MQTLVIEYARNVCGLERANSTEFDNATPYRVIYKLRELKGVDELGGTMRLGAYPASSQPAASPAKLTEPEISERHRHRYEFNREYEDILTEHGLKLTGQTPDGMYVEICEIDEPSLVPRLPVPPRVQIETTRAASAVPGIYRSRDRVPPRAPRRLPLQLTTCRLSSEQGSRCS